MTLSLGDIELISIAKDNPTKANLVYIASLMETVIPSEADAETILKAVTKDKEAGLTTLLNNYNIVIGDSLERIALMSLFFNSNGKTINNNLIGPKLLAALKNGNRVEAWYEICYNTNRNALSAHPPSDAQGIANRRYKEASEFGLYDPGTVSESEALQIYQMYTNHSARIIEYDAHYGGGLNSIASALQPAASVLEGIYGYILSDENIFATSEQNIPLKNGETINRSSDNADDLLIGGAGNDMLIGGAANNTYVYIAPTTGSTTETIDDSHGGGVGSIYVGDTLLTTADTVINFTGMDTASTQANPIYVWTGADGTIYKYSSVSIPTGAGFDYAQNTLTISGGSLATGDQIVINNFDLAQAESSAGYLGIHLQPYFTIAPGSSPLFPSTTASTTPTTEVTLGNSSPFTVYGAPGSQIQLTCNGSYAVSTGADLHLFSSGPATITIPEGQDYVTLSLIDLNNTNQADSTVVTASLTDGGGNVISSDLNVTFDNPNPAGAAGQGTPAVTLTAPNFDVVQTDGNGNDSLYLQYYSQTGQDNSLVTTTNDDSYVDFSWTHNDTILGGSGNDMVSYFDYYATGKNPSNNNLIVGGGGQDIISTWDGYNQIFADSQVDMATALAHRSGSASGSQGDVISVYNGDNYIVGSAGDDVILTGQGNNTIICGAGNNYVLGGAIPSGSEWWPFANTPPDYSYNSLPVDDPNVAGLGNSPSYVRPSWSISLSNYTLIYSLPVYLGGDSSVAVP